MKFLKNPFRYKTHLFCANCPAMNAQLLTYVITRVKIKKEIYESAKN